MKDIVEALKILGKEGKVRVDNGIYDEFSDILYDLGVNTGVEEGEENVVVYLD